MQSAIKLSRVDGDSIKTIRPLSEDEIQEVRGCNKEIFDFNRHFKLVEYVLHNFSCFKSGIEISLQKFSDDSSAIDRYDLNVFGHEVNINLLNLMMS